MKLLLTLLILISTYAFSYDRVLFVGAGGGFVYGLNETPDSERGFGGNFRLNAVYTNVLGQWVSAEIGFNYMWEDQETLSGFKMTGFQGDLRAKVYPLSFLGWNIAPYAAGGIGFLSYNSSYRVTEGDAFVLDVEAPDDLAPGEEVAGFTPVFSWGAGITWAVNGKLALEASFNHAFTGTDEINPWRDEKEVNDAYYLTELKVSYSLGDIFNIDSGD